MRSRGYVLKVSFFSRSLRASGCSELQARDVICQTAVTPQKTGRCLDIIIESSSSINIILCAKCSLLLISVAQSAQGIGLQWQGRQRGSRQRTSAAIGGTELECSERLCRRGWPHYNALGSSVEQTTLLFERRANACKHWRLAIARRPFTKMTSTRPRRPPPPCWRIMHGVVWFDLNGVRTMIRRVRSSRRLRVAVNTDDVQHFDKFASSKI